MAQVLSKEYECLTCLKPIKISKIDNPAPGQKKKWTRYELDGVTENVCKGKKQQQQVESFGPAKEVAAIRAQLLVLVSRLGRIEHQMMMKH